MSKRLAPNATACSHAALFALVGLEAIKTAERISSKLAVADAGRLRSLTSRYNGERERVRALARILMACWHPELIGK